MSIDRNASEALTEAGTSAALFAALEEAAAGDARRLGTLDRLRQSCDHLVAGGSRLSLSDIEAHCRSAFQAGPRAQTISNDKGLLAYVEARRSAIASLQNRKRAGTLDQGVEEILDPDLRARMRVLVEEYRLLRERQRILTHGLARLHPPLDLEAILLGRPSVGSESTAARCGRATAAQAAALQGLVEVLCDTAKLGRLGLETDHGDIVGRGMKETLIDDKHLRLLQALVQILVGDHESE
jgi:hypothetical protein